MKLAEALMNRNDIKSKIERVNDELNSVLITEHGVEQEFSAEDKMTELFNLMEDLHNLNIKIDRANIDNIERLQLLKNYDREIGILNGVRTRLLRYEKRKTSLYGSAEGVDQVKNLKLADVTLRLESVEQERRKVDRELQARNWQIEI